MSWQTAYPILTTWLDLRPYHGMALSTNSNYKFNTSVSFCYSPYYLYYSGLWYSSSYRIVETSTSSPKTNYCCYKASSPSANTNWTNFLSKYGLSYGYVTGIYGGNSTLTAYWLYRNTNATTTSCLFLPSRPLLNCPKETYTSTGSIATSLSGVTYKTSYGHHKTWDVSLYLDGYLDSTRPEYYFDVKGRFDDWLKLADVGVTLTVDRNVYTSFSRSRRTTAPYIDCPTNICGQLEQSNLTFEGTDDRCWRYKLDLTIHEAKGTAMYE